MVVVFDVKGKIFRNDMYSEYKVNCLLMLDDLCIQIVLLYNIIKVMGFLLISIEGVEVDDVIGIFVCIVLEQQCYVLILIGDKDMVQFVNEYVMLINIMIDSILDLEIVVEKFGVGFELIIDYFVLMGDKVDNILGVDGCGLKIVVKWL